MKGPAVPKSPVKGTRYDPPEDWLFGKGYYGPPDLRPHPSGYTYDQIRMWFDYKINRKTGLIYP